MIRAPTPGPFLARAFTVVFFTSFGSPNSSRQPIRVLKKTSRFDERFRKSKGLTVLSNGVSSKAQQQRVAIVSAIVEWSVRCKPRARPFRLSTAGTMGQAPNRAEHTGSEIILEER